MKSKSILFYLGELSIVIIGVTVAFWFNQISDDKKEKKIRDDYFRELRSDLKYDLAVLEHTIKLNTAKQEKMTQVIGYYEDPELYKDSIHKYAFEIGMYHFFEPRDVTYQSIITSGDFKLIDNKEIKREIIRLYGRYEFIEEAQDNFLNALDQNYFPFLSSNVDYLSGQPTINNFHNSVFLKNYFLYTVNDLTLHLQAYQVTITNAEKLDSLLQTELE